MFITPRKTNTKARPAASHSLSISKLSLTSIIMHRFIIMQIWLVKRAGASTCKLVHEMCWCVSYKFEIIFQKRRSWLLYVDHLGFFLLIISLLFGKFYWMWIATSFVIILIQYLKS